MQRTLRRHPRRVAAVGATALLVVALGASGAFAVHDSDTNRIKPVPGDTAGATHLARSILQGNQNRLIRARFVTRPPGGSPVAISTKRLAGFPRRGGAFAILSTGCARIADNKNRRSNSGCKNGGVRVRGARDVVIWRIRIRVPRGANCVSFRFKFLSEEYREFVDSPFNDAFIAELRGRSGAPQWQTHRAAPTITDPGNFARTRDGKRISVNATGVARVSRARARGTTFDAATRKLRASTRAKPGVHLLYLSIFDQGDRQYDSAVFVDKLQIGRRAHCGGGVTGTT